MAGASTVTPSRDEDTNSIIGGLKWDTLSLTYSIPTADFYDYTGAPDGRTALTAQQEAATHSAMRMFASVCGISLTEITESDDSEGDIRIGSTTTEGSNSASAWGPGTDAWSGDAWFDTGATTAAGSGNGLTTPESGNYGWFTFIHEIGHTLGLKHPHEESGSFPDTDVSLAYSIMTYRAWAEASIPTFDWDGLSFAQTPMMYDIAALQHMYGADYSEQANNGDTTYGWDPTTGQFFINGLTDAAATPKANKIFMTLWDGGGHDIYDLHNYGNNTKIDLRPGEWTTTSDTQVADLDGTGGSRVAPGTVANALLFEGNTASLIEDALGGGGNDEIWGNQIANFINGNGGGDTIYGEGGDDTLWGGSIDDDKIHGGWGADDIDGGLGDDKLYGDFKDVFEQGDADEIIGNGGKDSIQGGGGSDYIYGDFSTNPDDNTAGADKDFVSAGAGDDRVWGGGGDDTLYGANGLDLMYGGHGSDDMHGEGGDDTLYGGGTQSEGTSDRIWGGAGFDQLLAGWGDDEVYGEGDDDTIEGNGGKDYLEGGAGSDEIYGDNYSFDGTYQAGDDKDTLRGDAGIDYLYGGGEEDELDGGADNDNLYGGDHADMLLGGDGGDNLNGGRGNDQMWGGAGGDSYFVDSAKDRVLETVKNESDYVYSTSSYTLGKNLEYLLLQGTATRGTGNDGFNWIDGNNSINVIEGMDGGDFLYGYVSYDPNRGTAEDHDTIKGGAGSDFMYGGKGNDIYYTDGEDIYVNDSHEGFYKGYVQVVELKNEGNDTIHSTSDIKLHRNQYIEQLYLKGNAILAVGNEHDNRILGNGKDNEIDGGGGNDTLSGDDGLDRLLGRSGQDSLFGEHGNDRIDGGTDDDDIFGGIGADHLKGGTGDDEFCFEKVSESGTTNNTADQILDFGGGDEIDFSDFEVKLKFSATGEFTGVGACVITSKSGKDTIVEVDHDGDKIADMMILVLGTSVGKGDFDF
ncbi:MAG: hemolysin-type calcium-binding repeat family protein [Rhizobium sp.]|nr:hemolysin-type calcium-binding repeat family protein [Rhizobium sp.]